MPAKLVNSGGVARVQFACDRCGHNLIAGLEDLGGLFKCGQCGSFVRMPPVPCHYARCGGTYRRCGGVIRVRPEAAEELRRAEAEAERESAALGPGEPTDSYQEDVGDIRRSVRASVTRYRCGGCGATYSWLGGERLGYESGTARCDRVVCSVCARRPAAEELPEPDSIFNQALDSSFLYLWLDQADARIRRAAHVGEGFDTYENVVKRVVIAVGAKQSGHREVLACQLAEKLDHAFWTDFLGGLVARGVRSVGLAIAARSDGLDAALSDVLPGTPLQRSRTEFLNEVIALVPAPDRARAQRSLKGMFATSGQAAAQAQLLAVANGLEEVSSAAAEALRGSAGELFSYLAFPRRHWSHIGTLNGFKELNDRIGGRLYADDKAALSNAKVDCIAMNDSWKSEGAYVAPGRLHPTT